MSIVTKQGDSGKTRLFSGEEVSKSDPRLEAYGELDGLVSVMGLARGFVRNAKVAYHIELEQRRLFRLGAELATKDRSKVELDPIHSKDLREIEARIAEYESRTPLKKGFVIPGKVGSASMIDICRVQARRLERHMVGLKEAGEFDNEDAMIYANRLSDLLFIMARKEEM